MIVPQLINVDPCVTCNGTGEMECPTCEGQAPAVDNCDECTGIGTVECDGCQA